MWVAYGDVLLRKRKFFLPFFKCSVNEFDTHTHKHTDVFHSELLLYMFSSHFEKKKSVFF